MKYFKVSTIYVFMYKWLLTLLLLAVKTLALAEVKPFFIYSQKQFDEVVERINRGEEMFIVLHRGEFVLNESLKATAPLSIVGKKATITTAKIFNRDKVVGENSTHFIYIIDRSFGYYPVFYDDRLKVIPVSESVQNDLSINYLDADIISTGDVAQGAKLRLKIPSNLKHLKNTVFSRAFGYFDSGWGVVNFTLDHTDNEYLYCTTLNKCSTNNYLYDKSVHEKKIRFVIYNAELAKDAVYYDSNLLYIPKGLSKVYCAYEGINGDGMPTIEFHSDITLDGIRFIGLNGLSITSKIYNVCLIRNCWFEKTLKSAIH